MINCLCEILPLSAVRLKKDELGSTNFVKLAQIRQTQCQISASLSLKGVRSIEKNQSRQISTFKDRARKFERLQTKILKSAPKNIKRRYISFKTAKCRSKT